MLLAKCLAVAVLVGSTWAVPLPLRILTDTVYLRKDFVNDGVKIKDPDVTFILDNVPHVYVSGSLANRGTTLFLTDASVENSRGLVEYTIAGHIVNRGTVVVQHNNPGVPIRVNLPGGTRMMP